MSLVSQSEQLFCIAGTEATARPRQTLKNGDTFAIVDSHGDIGVVAGGADGIFHCDTRYLSRLEVLIDGMQPLLLGSNIRDDNTTLTVDLTNPDEYSGNDLILPKDTLHIVRTFFLWRGVAYLRLGIRNYGDAEVSCTVSIVFANDFADIFEVRGTRRGQRGNLRSPVIDLQSVALGYVGLDEAERTTTLNCYPRPDRIGGGIVSYTMSLSPQNRSSIFLSISCNIPPTEKVKSFFSGLKAASRELRAQKRKFISIGTSSDVFNQVLRRSMNDLHMLTTLTSDGAYPYAGVPWYSTTFGRDGLITALELLWCAPHIAKGVLTRLAALQAMSCDTLNDAEPGKIVHEMRGGEMAALREVPFERYYGSVDATPLFVLLAGAYAERTNDLGTVRALWPNIEAALGWIDGSGDSDGDGFIEYARATSDGLVNQGWKDSQDAIFHANGDLAKGPIALAEVQAYVFAAKQSIARCARRLGLSNRAAELEMSARRLQQRFEDAFWCDEIGMYALALDGEKRQCRVRTSNAGQVLMSGIASSERARKIADCLIRPEFLSGWGIRTVAVGEARYNPMSYHNGSIWPHDNALIAIGFARYGFKAEVDLVFQGLVGAASRMELRRLPELFCGFRRVRGNGLTRYPVACTPQAWASAAPLALVQASLGIRFDLDQNRISLVGPTLPTFLDMVVLRDVQVADNLVDFAVYRHEQTISIEILRNEGDVEVSIVY
ncbi:MAG TPA: amylo-alpha-1,6-glucosidase [Rhodopseudomonas sp.]|uniref:amylo-alpha-1,6-glucosidase n=1 Tax=Rhodopseudomonas sp. TaxID=1078 RepID=UPI002ED98438